LPNPDNLEAFTFLNRADAQNSSHNKETAEQLNHMEGAKFIDSHLVNRKAFANAAGQGLSVTELLTQDEKATAELLALFAHFPIIPNGQLIK
jgi:chromosome partitioning protein